MMIFARILEPDIFLPSQFYGNGGLSRQLEGEKRLMIAILKDAVECLDRYRVLATARVEAIMRVRWNGCWTRAQSGCFPLITSVIS